MNNTTLGKFNLNYEKRIIGLLGLDLVESKGANRWEIRDKLENSAGYVSLHKKTLTASGEPEHYYSMDISCNRVFSDNTCDKVILNNLRKASEDFDPSMNDAANTYQFRIEKGQEQEALNVSLVFGDKPSVSVTCGNGKEYFCGVDETGLTIRRPGVDPNQNLIEEEIHFINTNDSQSYRYNAKKGSVLCEVAGSRIEGSNRLSYSDTILTDDGCESNEYVFNRSVVDLATGHALGIELFGVIREEIKTFLGIDEDVFNVLFTSEVIKKYGLEVFFPPKDEKKLVVNK